MKCRGVLTLKRKNLLPVLVSGMNKIQDEINGQSIDISLDKSTYVMTISLIDKNGNTLSQKSVDFPMGTAFVNASYDEASKTMKFTLESGSTVDVPLGDLVEGLVSQTDFDTLSGEVETLKTEVNNNTNAISEIEANITTVKVRLEFEKGDLDDDDGLPVSSTEYKRTINYIKVIPNTEYTISRSNNYNLYVFGFQSEGIAVTDGTGTTYKFVVYNTTESEVCFTTTSTTQYIKVVVKNLDLSEKITFSLTNSIGEIVVDNMNNIDDINSNMSDYGLNNVFDGVWNQDTDGGKVISNYYSVNSGDTIRIENCSGDAVVLLYNSSKQWQSNITNAVENAVVIPSNISYFRILLSSSVALTPTTADKIRLYINNQIDVVKNSIQSGQNFSSTSSGTVTFPIPYKSIPNVVCTIIAPTSNTNSVIIKITNITEKKFDYITVKDNELNNDNTIQWISMGEL